MKKKIGMQWEKSNDIFRSIQLLAVPILKDLGTIKATPWMWLAPYPSITVGVWKTFAGIILLMFIMENWWDYFNIIQLLMVNIVFSSFVASSAPIEECVHFFIFNW
jgi:hypothetical protein